MKPISVQLYSLREASKTDFVGVLKRIAAIGYAGVEPAGFYNLKPAEFRKIVEDLGMKVSSSHGPWAKPDNLNEVIDTAKILGIDLVSSGYGANEFKDMDAIQKTAEITNKMQETLAKAGLRLFLHNHHWEFCPVDGKLAYDHFATLSPKVLFEIDTYWASNFGQNNPAEQVKKFNKRAPLLHIKDGPLVQGKSHVAVGSGKMDIPSVVAAADPKVLECLVVELDNCDTDMATAVEASYKYLVGKGLAKGNKKV